MDNNQDLATKIRYLRNQKGFSQEQLSEITNLSLRTIQRTENNKSTPRGDTIIRLAQALQVTPEELLETVDTENKNKGYLLLLNLSAASILFQPMLGILIPFIIWAIRKEKSEFINNTGKKIINFQITWVLSLYAFIIITSNGTFIPFEFNFTDVFLRYLDRFTMAKTFPITNVIISLLYFYNLILISVNIKRNLNGIYSKYAPSILFLR